jgi:streptomycin 6-kinase
MDARIPPNLPVVLDQATRPPGQRWLPTLPRLIDAAVERWGLELGPPFFGGSAAWVAPARRRSDGLEGVLKVTLPHREARYEGAGLRLWDGAGSVRLYAEDEDDFALFIERCRPGTTLQEGAEPVAERLSVSAGLLRRLWAQAVPDDAPFETVEDVCGEWAALLRRRMDEHRPNLDVGLVETGADLLERLPATASRQVLVHGDFNPTNVLRAERERWLAIDAKPMVGDPGYDVLPLVTQVEPTEATDGDRLRRNFGLVASIVEEPVERLLAWGVARMVESSLWHVSLDEPEQAADNLRWARTLADLAGL